MVGVLGAFALVLGAAGLAKILNPRPTGRAIISAELPRGGALARPIAVRLIGGAETLVAATVFVIGGAISAGLLAVAYLVLALVADRLRRRAPGQDCGCFGGSADPVGRWHVAVDLGAAAVGILGMATATGPVLGAVAGRGILTGVLLGGSSVGLAWLIYLLMTALPRLSQATLASPVVARATSPRKEMAAAG